MNLTSCSCGVVLDKDKLQFDDELRLFTDEGVMDISRATFNQYGTIVAFVSCPTCGNDILEDS